MKRSVCVLLTCVLLLSLTLSGCFKSKEKQGLLSAFKMGKPVSARFYTSFAEEDKQVEELDSSRLGALTETLERFHYKTHFFHTDYYWDGRFGIELSLDDGTFWIYDGTLMKHTTVSILDKQTEPKLLDRDFVEVTDADFWETMREFFPSINPGMLLGSW